MNIVIDFLKQGAILIMKKVWKYILSILAVIILATAGTVYYFLNVKTYDIEDEKIQEIIETVYEIILPGEFGEEEPVMNNASESNTSDETASKPTDSTSKPATDSNEDKANEETTVSQDTTSNTDSTSTPNSTENNSTSTKETETVKESTPTPEKKPTVTAESIKEKYRPVFLSLQSQANGKLDALLGRAIGEYQAKKASGESISYAYFYQKYTSAGRALESNTDAAFYYIYGALENELKKHGFSPSLAQSFKDEYAASKNAREAVIFSMAKNGL
jgi:hypothetical protein